MREVLGARRAGRRGWEAGDGSRGGTRDEAGSGRAARRATNAMGHKIARAYGYATHTKPQGFISRPNYQ